MTDVKMYRVVVARGALSGVRKELEASGLLKSFVSGWHADEHAHFILKFNATTEMGRLIQELALYGYILWVRDLEVPA